MERNNAAGQERRGTAHGLMRRHERSSAGLLLLMIFATFLLLQVSAQSSEDASKGQVEAQTAGMIKVKKKRCSVHSVHLRARYENLSASKDADHVLGWNNLQQPSKIKLVDNGTCVFTRTGGFYLVNLRMSYRVPQKECPCVDVNGKRSLCYLNVSVMRQSSDYPEWLTVVEGKQTMTCNEGSSQAINLVRVIFLSQPTVMRVIVDPKNLQLISWTSENYFEVTRL